jgi:hypothetical protein
MMSEEQKRSIQRYMSYDEVRGRYSRDVEVEDGRLASIQSWTGEETWLNELRSLGFVAETKTTVAFGSPIGGGGHALEMLTLVIRYGGGTAGAVIGLNQLIKAITELPENFKKLRAMVTKAGAFKTNALDFSLVNEWLDDKYGPKSGSRNLSKSCGAGRGMIFTGHGGQVRRRSRRGLEVR